MVRNIVEFLTITLLTIVNPVIAQHFLPEDFPIPEKGDLILNEVLFNPFPDGADYVEIYNLSEKEFQLNKLFLASRDKNLELTQIYNLSGKNVSIKANEYIVFTKDTNAVYPFFFIECRTCFQQIDKMPSFNNDDDYVVLLNENIEIIDELFYTEDFHNPLLSDVEGISLERISFTKETNSLENWTSASTESGYGTPGYKNSQAKIQNIIQSKITFEPDSFSPNFDGYNDEFKIKYELEKPGYLCNVKIFDSKGRYIHDLVKNKILGTTGEITWNGEDETRQCQPIGIYVVLVEIFNTEGEIFRFKDGVTLTDILK